jgi:gluconate kinase
MHRKQPSSFSRINSLFRHKLSENSKILKFKKLLKEKDKMKFRSKKKLTMRSMNLNLEWGRIMLAMSINQMCLRMKGRLSHMLSISIILSQWNSLEIRFLGKMIFKKTLAL